MSETRNKSDGIIVGKSVISFEMPNTANPDFPMYHVGHLLIPPKGIKDSEYAGMCAKVFTVVKGQAKSIEVSFGNPNHNDTTGTWDPRNTERFLLAPGDNLLVPPGNSYRLQNHSITTECLLSWTIIRPNPSRLAETDHED